MLTLLNFTAVAPEKLAPKIVTHVPASPRSGIKLVNVGALLAATVKLLALMALPNAFLTVMGPVIAPAGTTAVIEVSETTVNTAANDGCILPVNLTSLVEVKFDPEIDTVEPIGPEPGEKLFIVGGGGTGMFIR